MDPVLLSLIGIVVVAATGWISNFFARRKMGADTADVLTGTAMRLVEQMEKRITDLELRLSRAEERERLGLEREVASTRRIADLNAEIRELRRTDTARVAREDQAAAVAIETAKHPIPLDVTITDNRESKAN